MTLALRHSRELTLVCSRKLTQLPAFCVDDNAFPTCGLRIKAQRFLWDTLSEHKWVILGERRGATGTRGLSRHQSSHTMAQITPYEEAAFARCVRSGKHPLNEIRFGILNHEEIIQPSQAAR